MNRILLVIAAFLIFASNASFAQSADSSAELTGFVRDSITREALTGVVVEIAALHRGARTNIKGAYRIAKVPAGEYDVTAKLYGYGATTIHQSLPPGAKLELSIDLASLPIQGDEIVVMSDREHVVEQQRVSSISLTPKFLELMPKVGGETDLFRVLQMLPGVKSLSEVSSGLYIRGGAPDQNLILLDHSVVYNPTHLFGFFSTFNSDAIKDITLIKGGYPAEYGGRLTGVLDVTTREGDHDQIHGKTSIGLISARQTLEIPVTDHASLLVSGRRTYLDALFAATNADSWLGGGDPLPRYYFYDLNGKLSIEASENDKLSLTGYFGDDHLSYPVAANGNIELGWGNKLGGIEWTHLLSPSMYLDVFGGYTEYSSASTGLLNGNAYNFSNGISEYNAKVEWDWRANDMHHLRSGVGLSRYNFTLFNSIGTTNKPLRDTGGVPKYLTLYAEDDWSITPALHASYGLRAEWLEVAQGVTFDPRLTLSYALSDLWSVKASVGEYHQFLHLVSIGEVSFFDLWIPGTSPLPPSQSTQYILGISGYPDEKYFASCEIYYKKLNNIVEYNQTKFLSNDIREIFPLGTGQAYGIEFYLQKRIGRLTGWLGYTLSFVSEKFDVINNGVAFSPKYDQRHDVQFVANYKLSDRWEAGLTWTYATGQANTTTLGYYRMALDEVGFGGDLLVPDAMGGDRLPAYHRMDASLAYSFGFFGKPAKFSIDIFNLYSHRNVWFEQVNTDTKPATKSYVLLLPILPTIGLEVTY